MRRKTSRSHFMIFFALLGLMSISKGPIEYIQGSFVACVSPFWNQLLYINSSFQPAAPENQKHDLIEDFQKLQIENSLLREEILNLKNIMQHEFSLLAQIDELLHEEKTSVITKNIKRRHQLELLKLLQVQLQATPAKVIFRSPSTWNSSLWINVGSETNDATKTNTIVKNSPVLLGKAVIGVIDYVGKKQSRVRLITDNGLSPSVRAARGDIKTMLKLEKLREAVKLLDTEGSAFEDPKQQDELVMALETVIEKLLKESAPSSFLAKGEIHGSSKPLWRQKRHELSGSGFNYDFADEFGPARDLRTGKSEISSDESNELLIIQVGDILVTTGLDGVFPPGLPVAEVTHVYPLKEGDYYYEIDALPVAGNLDDLSLVFVIPPLTQDCIQ